MTEPPRMHGRTHCPGGSDPIPCIAELFPTGGYPDYATGVLATSDLVAYWRLGDGAEPYLDTSGFNVSDPAELTITHVGGWVAMTQDYTPGGLSVDDDGAVAFVRAGAAGAGAFGDSLQSQYFVDTTRMDFPGNDPFTVACWIRPTASGSTWTASIVGNVVESSSHDNGWRLDMTWPARTVAIVRAPDVAVAGSYPQAVSPAGLAADTWHYVVGVYDGAELLLYLNAALVASQADSGTVGGLGGRKPTIGIGSQSHSTNDGWFYGAVDEVAVWSRALTADEIAALYQSGTSGSADSSGKVLTSDGSGGASYEYPTVDVDGTRYDTILTGANLTSTDNSDGTVTLAATSSGASVDDTACWMPLTTTVGGDDVLVFDADHSLIPTLVPF